MLLGGAGAGDASMVASLVGFLMFMVWLVVACGIMPIYVAAGIGRRKGLYVVGSLLGFALSWIGVWIIAKLPPRATTPPPVARRR